MKSFFVGILFVLFVNQTALAEADTKQIEITVNGLVCDFCARAVEKVFRQEFDVKDIQIDLSEKRISLRVSNDTEISDEKIKQLVTDAGYSFVSVTREEAR